MKTLHLVARLVAASTLVATPIACDGFRAPPVAIGTECRAQSDCGSGYCVAGRCTDRCDYGRGEEAQCPQGWYCNDACWDDSCDSDRRGLCWCDGRGEEYCDGFGDEDCDGHVDEGCGRTKTRDAGGEI